MQAQLMEVKYTKIETESDLMLHCIKADLTPSLRMCKRSYY
jgi:hypothetical protein